MIIKKTETISEERKKEKLNMDILAAKIRINALRGFGACGAGHVGGSMSMSDLMAVLYGDVMKIDPSNPKWEERDWIVVSKGHCGPALYAALSCKGYFPEEEMLTMNKPGTNLPSHCDRLKTPGVDMTTGSLGQGMSTALGVAWGHRLLGMDNYTYLILGDGESQEGQVWEGALFGGQRKLSHLIAFLDYNKKQLDGDLKNICDLGDYAQKFRDFGWHAVDVDGHDVLAIKDAITEAKANTEKPSMIVLHTEKGRGCSFAEGVYYNHHMPVSKEDSEAAIHRLELEVETMMKEMEV